MFLVHTERRPGEKKRLGMGLRRFWPFLNVMCSEFGRPLANLFEFFRFGRKTRT